MSNPQDEKKKVEAFHQNSSFILEANQQISLIRHIYQEIQQRLSELDKDVMSYLMQKTDTHLENFTPPSITFTAEDFTVDQWIDTLDNITELQQLHLWLMEQVGVFYMIINNYKNPSYS